MKSQVPFSSIERFVKVEGVDPASIVERKQNLGISVDPDEERTVVAIISTNCVDADGDIIIPDGIDTRTFETNPVVMWSHAYSQPPVGKVVELTKSSSGLVAKIKFAATEAASEIWSLIQGGFLKANSIGFVTKKAFLKGTKEFSDCFKSIGMLPPENCRRVIKECMLLENSVCAIPANREALVQVISSKSMTLSPKMVKELGLVEEHDVTLKNDIEELKASQASMQLAMKEFLDALKKQVDPVEIKEEKPEEKPAVVQKPDLDVVTIVVPPAVAPAKPAWTVVRNGPAKLSDEDRAEAMRQASEVAERRKKGRC